MRDFLFLSRSASIYLNRACPRKCPACDVVKGGFSTMCASRWMEAFDILRDRGVSFFLILGAEPLVYPRRDLLDLVSYWSREDFEYGFYTAAPLSKFEELKRPLIESGLLNWSSGCDFVPVVYDELKSEGKLSDLCIDLVENSEGGAELRKKAEDVLYAMGEMLSLGISEAQLTITVYRSNIEFVPEMVQWMLDQFPSPLCVSLNYVNRGDIGLDFASSGPSSDRFFLREEDATVFDEFVSKMDGLGEEYWDRIQVPRSYLFDRGLPLTLDRRGSPHYCPVSVECDGSMRLCGYRRGDGLDEWSVFDLADDDKFLSFLQSWEFQATHCFGCGWNCCSIINEPLYLAVNQNPTERQWLTNYRSEGWRSRMGILGDV